MATRRITEFLDGHSTKYVLISHSPAYTAADVAVSSHLPLQDMAKTVVVDLDGQFVLAVVPANRDVDFSRLATAAGAVFARLATEAEFVGRFEGCELGAMPPFGCLFGMETFVDRSLAREPYIAFNAGTHRDTLIMDFAEYARVAYPRVADFAKPRPEPALQI